MAGRLMSRCLNVAAAPRWTITTFCLLTSMICPVYAEEFSDPTRPPASIFAPTGGVVVGSVREAKINSSSGLNSVIISKNHRVAIIDGQTVELGGKHGNATLVEINEGGVVLQRAQSRQVLTLFPDVKITHKETADKKSEKNELKIERPSSIGTVQTDIQNSKSTVPREGK